MLQGVCVWGSKHLLNFVARYCMKGEHSVVFSSRSDTCDIQSCIYKEMLYYSLFCGEQTSEIERDVTFCTLQLPSPLLLNM